MAQMSIGGCTDKSMVYTYIRILFSQKKEGSNDTCYNLDEPTKHCAKYRKLDK